MHNSMIRERKARYKPKYALMNFILLHVVYITSYNDFVHTLLLLAWCAHL